MGAGVQPESMAQMLQMITSLGDLQVRKQQLAQGAAQFKQSLALEATKLGFDQDNANWGKVQTLLSNISNHSTGASDAIIELGKLANMQPAQITQLQKFALTAPQTAEAIRNQSAANGLGAMTPQQQAPINAQAATTAMTGGMNTGQMGQAQMLGQIASAGSAQLSANPQLTNTLGAGMAGNMSMPMQGLTQIAGANTPGLPQAAASIQAGTTVGAVPAMQNKTQLLEMQANLQLQQAQQQIALLGLARRQSLDPAEAVTALDTMSKLAAQASDPKMEPGTRAIVWSTYNSIAKRVDPTGAEGLLQTDPTAKNAGAIQTQINKFTGANNVGLPSGTLPGQVIQQMPQPSALPSLQPGIVPFGPPRPQ